MGIQGHEVGCDLGQPSHQAFGLGKQLVSFQQAGRADAVKGDHRNSSQAAATVGEEGELLEGLALLELHRPEVSMPMFSDAVAAADALLVLTGQNVAALQARALALSGLAAITGDPAQVTRRVRPSPRPKPLPPRRA